MSKKPNDSAADKADWRSFLALVRTAKPSGAQIALALGLNVLTAAGGLTVPLVTRNLVDGFAFDADHVGRIVLMLGLFLVSAVTSGIAIFLMNRIGQQVLYKLRDRLWKKLLALPVSHYDRTRSGELVSRMTNDTGIVKTLISEHLATLVSGAMSIVGSLVLLLVLDWRMTLLLALAIPLTALVLVPMGRQMYKISRSMQDETAG